MKKRLLTLFLAICMICTLLPFNAFADNIETVSYDITYKQTEARSMLKMVNDFRTGNEAWQWNENDTQKVYIKGLGNLVYDYTLEKIAMQRAAEIAIQWGHTRPNNTDCFSIYDELNIWCTKLFACGENLAAGYTSAQAAFKALQETNMPYAGQGHRRNMIDSDYNAIGIACVEYNGCLYWVQELGEVVELDTAKTKANDSKTTVSTDVAMSAVTSVDISTDAETPIIVAPGKSVKLPDVTTKMWMTNSWPGECEVTPSYTWTSSAPKIAKISDGKIVGVAEGSVTITVSAMGSSLNIPVKVHTQSYTGKETKPDTAKNPFVDVKKADYYYDSVLWAYYHNPQITTGVDKTHFAPGNNCTRGQIVTFLWRAKGCPEVKGVKNPFKDVKSSDYYYDAVLWAVSEKITTGIDNTHFAPNNTCTRAQSVTFMWRAEGQHGVKDVKNPFKDVKTSDYYYKAVLWALGKNITNGVDNTHFAPNNTCTRGQIVTFLYRDMA